MWTFKKYIESSLFGVFSHTFQKHKSQAAYPQFYQSGLSRSSYSLLHVFFILVLQVPATAHCLFKLLRDENNINELGARSPLKRNMTCWRCSYPNSYIHLQTEMCEGRSLLKCEASLSLQVKVITEQREATGWRGRSKASVLHSHYYPFQADRAAEDAFNTGNIFISHPDIM